ncbi:MAG: hypothetical protein IJ661_07515 [Lachnospiraceae bacterium]|nr:hypothetical protein [Lachnospiraceae bacterium]
MADYYVLGKLFEGLTGLNSVKKEIKQNGYTEKLFDILEEDIKKKKLAVDSPHADIRDYGFYYLAITNKIERYIEAGRFEDALDTFERIPWEEYKNHLNYPGKSANDFNGIKYVAAGIILYLIAGNQEKAEYIYHDAEKLYTYFRKHGDLGHVNAILSETFLFYKQGDFEKAATTAGACKKDFPKMYFAMYTVLEGKLAQKLGKQIDMERQYASARAVFSSPGVEKWINELQ